MKFNTTVDKLINTVAHKHLQIKEEFGEHKITVEIKRYRKKRSLDQNALMWVILDKMAKHLNIKAEDVYFDMLKHYGVHEYLAIPKNSQNKQAILRTLRYYEIEDSILENAIRIKCFIGSSEYDTKQMTVLIDGILAECENIKLDVSYESQELKSLLAKGVTYANN